MTNWTPPPLGTTKANLMTSTKNPTVQVRVFKFDSIRQEAYWVTKIVRVFKTMASAQEYISRINT